MSDEQETTTKKGFWQTLPGIITGIAGILTAATGLFLAINNFKSASAKPEDSTGQVKSIDKVPETSQPPHQEIITVGMAEKLTTDFLTAFKNKDIDGLMVLLSVPFFNDHNIQTDLGDIRAKFQANWQEKGNNPFPEIRSIKVKTVKEWKDQGVLDSRDRNLHALNISDDDYYAGVEFDHDGLAIAFRKVDGKLKIAGIWD